MFIIKNAGNGVTSEDVKSCTDLNVIEGWYMEQVADMASLDLQIERAERYYKEIGEYEDKNHYVKLKGAHRLQSALFDIIKARKDALQREYESLNGCIIKVIRQNMTDDEWELLVEEAKELQCND